MKYVLAFFLTALLPTASYAISLQDFQGLSETSRRAFLRGSEEAYGFANAHLAEDARPRLYCAPENTALSTDDLQALVLGYTIRNEYSKDFPVSLILLAAMQEAYPCYFEPND